ncbi:hypothetical protein [Xenorhabdus entomophaga]|uniref:hypothetical protein n=1 Tax=Xenorhabdus entomophaga TaxID=3136257 RepID=UPI0030F41B11
MLISDENVKLNEFFIENNTQNKFYHVLDTKHFVALVTATRVDPYTALACLSIYNSLILDSLVPNLAEMINNDYEIEEEKSASGKCKGYASFTIGALGGTCTITGLVAGIILTLDKITLGGVIGFGVGICGAATGVCGYAVNAKNHTISRQHREHRDHKLNRLKTFINSFISEIKRQDDYAGEFLENRKKQPLVALECPPHPNKYYIPYNKGGKYKRNLAFDRTNMYRDILVNCIDGSIIRNYCNKCPGQTIVNQPTRRLLPVQMSHFPSSPQVHRPVQMSHSPSSPQVHRPVQMSHFPSSPQVHSLSRIHDVSQFDSDEETGF